MRTIKLFISIILVATIIAAFSSCKGKGGDADPEPDTEATRVTKVLTSGKWKLTGLTVDGVAKSLYPDLNITFTTTAFSAGGGQPVWPATGTWTFTDDTAKAFTRNDQTVVAIESISDSNLTLSLTWTQTSLGPGRTSAIAGKHVFVMSK